MCSVAERLIALRGTKSRRSFAEELGTKESTLRNYEQGVTQPTADFLRDICKNLRVSPHWLLLGEGSRHEPGSGPPVSGAELAGLKKRVAELELELKRLETSNRALAEESKLAWEMRCSRDKDVEHYRKIIDGLMAYLQALAPRDGKNSGTFAPAFPGSLTTPPDRD